MLMAVGKQYWKTADNVKINLEISHSHWLAMCIPFLPLLTPAFDYRTSINGGRSFHDAVGEEGKPVVIGIAVSPSQPVFSVPDRRNLHSAVVYSGHGNQVLGFGGNR